MGSPLYSAKSRITAVAGKESKLISVSLDGVTLNVGQNSVFYFYGESKKITKVKLPQFRMPKPSNQSATSGFIHIVFYSGNIEVCSLGVPYTEEVLFYRGSLTSRDKGATSLPATNEEFVRMMTNIEFSDSGSIAVRIFNYTNVDLDMTGGYVSFQVSTESVS